ncbi:MAG: DUF1338 family protein [Ideonella sp.]|nr:DUF1338 family protein [Ideonella sp.]
MPSKNELPFVAPDDICPRFSDAMSAMYRREVPQYGALLALVAQVNGEQGGGSRVAFPSFAAHAAEHAALVRRAFGRTDLRGCKPPRQGPPRIPALIREIP